jgi:ketosteroid isomerase-like protein
MANQTQDVAGLRTGTEETNKRFEQAFNRGDPAGAAREVYTAGATILPPGAPMVQGRDAIAQFWIAAQESGVRRVQLSTVSLEPMGEGAYEIGRAALTLADGGQMQVKYVVLWRREEDRWRWHVDIWNA